MTVRVALLGTVLEVRAPAPLLQRVAALVPTTSAPAARLLELDERGLRLDGVAVGPVPAPAQALEHLLAAVNAAAVEAVGSLAVHAGAVAAGDAVLAWPAVSGAGKSTLVAACLQAGFDYVSDEALVLSGGHVRPYPKWLSLSAWSLAALGLPPPEPGAGERPVAAAELGARPAEEPLRPAALLRLERAPGPPALLPREPAEGAVLLLEHAFNHYRDGAASFAEAAAVAAAAPTWVLRYDDPRAAARLLHERWGTGTGARSSP